MVQALMAYQMPLLKSPFPQNLISRTLTFPLTSVQNRRNSPATTSAALPTTPRSASSTPSATSTKTKLPPSAPKTSPQPSQPPQKNATFGPIHATHASPPMASRETAAAARSKEPPLPPPRLAGTAKPGFSETRRFLSLSASEASLKPNRGSSTGLPLVGGSSAKAALASRNKSVDVKEKYHESQIPVPLNNSHVTEITRLEAEEVEVTTNGIEVMAKIRILPGIRPDDPKIFRRYPLENRFPAAEIGRHIVNVDGFSFPIADPPAEESARVSLEVFRPSPRKLAEFYFSCKSGDRRSFILSPKTLPTVDDDVASDASSDLFEIESLSSLAFDPRKISTGVSRLWRGVDDEDVAAMSIAPSECYPPSEVSVEWSVPTAEGFDRPRVANFSSAVSEYEELRYVKEAVSRGKKKGVSGVGGLLSCRSEKAVCVVGSNSDRFGQETRRRLVDSASAVALDRVIGVARLGGVNPVHDGPVAIGLCGQARFP